MSSLPTINVKTLETLLFFHPDSHVHIWSNSLNVETLVTFFWNVNIKLYYTWKILFQEPPCSVDLPPIYYPPPKKCIQKMRIFWAATRAWFELKIDNILTDIHRLTSKNIWQKIRIFWPAARAWFVGIYVLILCELHFISVQNEMWLPHMRKFYRCTKE